MTVFFCSKFALMTTDAPCTISRRQLDDIIDDAVDSAHTDIQFLWPLPMGSGIHPLGHWPDFVYHIRSWFITLSENLIFFATSAAHCAFIPNVLLQSVYGAHENTKTITLNALQYLLWLHIPSQKVFCHTLQSIWKYMPWHCVWSFRLI